MSCFPFTRATFTRLDRPSSACISAAMLVLAGCTAASGQSHYEVIPLAADEPFLPVGIADDGTVLGNLPDGLPDCATANSRCSSWTVPGCGPRRP